MVTIVGVEKRKNWIDAVGQWYPYKAVILILKLAELILPKYSTIKFSGSDDPSTIFLISLDSAAEIMDSEELDGNH